MVLYGNVRLATVIRNNNVESSSHHMIILNHMTIFNRYPDEVTKVRGDF